MKGLILYGPPASGKTTVAAALEQLDPRYVTFRRLKAGGGRTDGYRMTTIETINALDARGEIIWRNDRYGATYAVDRPTLLAQVAESVPVVQLGQIEAIDAVTDAVLGVRWYVIALQCSRELALKRMIDRGDVDLEQRLAAWAATRPPDQADLVINTALITPTDIAAKINRVVTV